MIFTSKENNFFVLMSSKLKSFYLKYIEVHLDINQMISNVFSSVQTYKKYLFLLQLSTFAKIYFICVCVSLLWRVCACDVIKVSNPNLKSH